MEVNLFKESWNAEGSGSHAESASSQELDSEYTAFNITSKSASSEKTASGSSSELVSESEFESKAKLLPGIIVMNHKYFLDLKNEAPNNGDMPFVMTVIRVLQKANAFLGMILYLKKPQLLPKVTYTIINNVNCAVIPFNEKMYPYLLTDAITKACKHLVKLAGRSEGFPPMIYHQDERLLQYQLRTIPFAITHHGPIVADVIRYFPCPSSILSAFGTDSHSWQKVNDLTRLQLAGIEVVKDRHNGFVLAMSDIQKEHCIRSGVSPSSIISIPPPLKAMLSVNDTQCSRQSLHGVNRKHFLFTAVARLTWFKHAELLIDGAILLLERGLDLSLLIAGGDSSTAHSEIRQALMDRVPSQFRKNVEIIKRIPQEELYSYFNSQKVRESSIFVCCSRYETLGITPLEAALSGVTTVITNSGQVEAAKYFPEEFKFEPNAMALANCLEGLFERNLKVCRQELETYIENEMKERGEFEDEFLNAWRKLSLLSR